jgi:hypothetical protein
MDQDDDTIYYDGGFYVAERLEQDSDELNQAINLDAEKGREMEELLKDALNVLFNSKIKINEL